MEALIAAPQLLIDDQPNTKLSNAIVSVMVEETAAGLARCEIIVVNWGSQSSGQSGYLFLDRKTIDFGMNITLQLGNKVIFVGRVTGLEAQYPESGGALLTILAEDRFQAMRMTRRSRSFTDVTDTDLLEGIAREHGLETDIRISGPTHRLVAQVNLSDLAFLRERARAVNAELWIEGEKLFAWPRSEWNSEPISLTYGVGLINFSVCADLAHQCSELRISGWDVAGKSAILETADSNTISAELKGLTSGSDILKDTFQTKPAQMVHTVPLTSAEARQLVESRYREMARQFVAGTGVADGNPDIQVGRLVYLSDLGTMFGGEYAVVRVLHTYNSMAGYRTEFDVERAGIGAA